MIYLFQKIANNLYMKIDQKNSRNLFMAFSCMFEEVKPVGQVKSIKWHLNNHIWSLNLNLWFKPTSFNCVASCISSIHNILPCNDHASYCALHWLCFFLCCRCCSLSVDVFRRWVRWHRWRPNVIFRSARQAKPHWAFRYNPTLLLSPSFTALGQQRFNCYLLQ